MDFDQAVAHYYKRDTQRRQEMYVQLARSFHESYERMAPEFGYETREDTRTFDPASPNGRLMIAVMKDLFR